MKNQSHILLSQLRTAAEMWEEIRDATVPADRWLAGYFFQHRKRVGSRDRRFYSETIYSCFRHKLFLETWLRSFSYRQNSFTFVTCAAVREGLLSEEDFAMVTVRTTKETASHGIQYAHIRGNALPAGCRFASIEEEYSVRYSFPLRFVSRWSKRYGQKECESLLQACQQRPPLTIRTNTLKISREELLARFRENGYQVQPTMRSSCGIVFSERVALFDSEEFRGGLFEVQDEGSQILCEVIQPSPGALVWDACAGGGGKSLALAALMRNKGRIIATDIRSWKLQDLKKRAQRAGAYNIFPADIARMNEIKTMKDGADIILVDAPCSGSGTLRRNPDARWKLREDDLQRRQSEQLGILESVLPHLKKGGKLFYATCSLEPEENDDVIRMFREKHPTLEKISLDSGDDGFLRLLPHRDGTDGFFMAGCALTPLPPLPSEKTVR